MNPSKKQRLLQWLAVAQTDSPEKVLLQILLENEEPDDPGHVAEINDIMPFIYPH